MSSFGRLVTPPREGVDWERMNFGMNTKETAMVLAKHSNGAWSELASADLMTARTKSDPKNQNAFSANAVDIHYPDP